MFTLTDFSDLSTREHYRQIQKNTLNFEKLHDHQNGSDSPLWWWLSSNTALQHFPLRFGDFKVGPQMPSHMHTGS